MNVTYTTQLQNVAAVIKTTMTAYMWPGFLAEMDHSTQEFHVWQLQGPNTWLPRPDIVAPPLDCIGVETRAVRKTPDQVELAQDLWRRLTPLVQGPQGPQVQPVQKQGQQTQRPVLQMPPQAKRTPKKQPAQLP